MKNITPGATTFSVRMSPEMKKEFSRVCGKMGLTMSQVVSSYIHKVVELGGIPQGVVSAGPAAEQEFSAEEACVPEISPAKLVPEWAGSIRGTLNGFFRSAGRNVRISGDDFIADFRSLSPAAGNRQSGKEGWLVRFEKNGESLMFTIAKKAGSGFHGTAGVFNKGAAPVLSRVGGAVSEPKRQGSLSVADYISQTESLVRRYLDWAADTYLEEVTDWMDSCGGLIEDTGIDASETLPDEIREDLDGAGWAFRAGDTVYSLCWRDEGIFRAAVLSEESGGRYREMRLTADYDTGPEDIAPEDMPPFCRHKARFACLEDTPAGGPHHIFTAKNGKDRQAEEADLTHREFFEEFEAFRKAVNGCLLEALIKDRLAPPPEDDFDDVEF